AERPARLVHVRLGLQQRDARVSESDLRERPRELRAPRAAAPPRGPVHPQPARVVPRALVLPAGVAKAGDEQVQRRGALAPTEEAHLLPAGFFFGGRLGLALARSLLALGHCFLALGQLALLELLALDLLGLGLDDAGRH